MQTGFKHRTLFSRSPTALLSPSPPGLLPAQPILHERFLASERKYFPCAVGDAETDFGCLMTDGY